MYEYSMYYVGMYEYCFHVLYDKIAIVRLFFLDTIFTFLSLSGEI